MTYAPVTVIGCVIGGGEEVGLSSVNPLLTDDRASFDINSVIAVRVFTDCEHRVGTRVGSRRLHKLDVAVRAAEVIRCDRPHSHVMRPARVRHERPELYSLIPFVDRYGRVNESAE